MWHRGWWFVARPGRAGPGRKGLREQRIIFGPIKHFDYVRVNLCTLLDLRRRTRVGGGAGSKREGYQKHRLLSYDRRDKRAQAKSLVLFFSPSLSHAVLRSSIATGRERFGEFVMVSKMDT